MDDLPHYERGRIEVTVTGQKDGAVLAHAEVRPVKRRITEAGGLKRRRSRFKCCAAPVVTRAIEIKLLLYPGRLPYIARPAEQTGQGFQQRGRPRCLKRFSARR